MIDLVAINMVNRSIDDGTKIQSLTLLANGLNLGQTSKIVGISASQLCKLRKKAISRGWEGKNDSPLLLEYVADEPQSGRPRKDEPDLVAAFQDAVERSAEGRHATLQDLAIELDICSVSIHRYLTRLGYKKLKMTTKPRFTEAMRQARLKFCLEHEDWSLENWKDVVWTDETSVVFGQQRGRRRI